VTLAAKDLGFHKHKRSARSTIYRAEGDVSPYFVPIYNYRYGSGFNIQANIGVDIESFEKYWLENSTPDIARSPEFTQHLFWAFALNFHPTIEMHDFMNESEPDKIDNRVAHIINTVNLLPRSLSTLREFFYKGNKFCDRDTSIFLAQRSKKSDAFRLWARDQGVSFDDVEFKEAAVGRPLVPPLAPQKITFEELGLSQNSESLDLPPVTPTPPE
jgi:hypothetical protein